MTDATTELIRVIGVNFMNFTSEDIRSRSWVSGTFAGARHELTFRVEGEGAQGQADLFLDGLEEAEFDLRGHILADIALVSRSADDAGSLVRISLEALTVEDW
jgi:hypothetical protein